MAERGAGSGAGRGAVGPVLLGWVDAPAPRAAGRLLLADLVAELIAGAEIGFASVCTLCGGTDHGRPVAVGLPVALSLSYAGSLVVAGAVHNRDAAALGIDVERERSVDGPMAELAALFAPGAPPDLRGWTMIEAAAKADGRGLRVAPGGIALGVPDAGRAPASVLGEAALGVSVPGRSGAIEAAPAVGPAGFVLSVAIVPLRARRGAAAVPARRATHATGRQGEDH